MIKIKKYLINICLWFILSFFLVGCLENKDIIKDERYKFHSAFYNTKGDKIALSTVNGAVIITDNKLKIISAFSIHNSSANTSFFSECDDNIISCGLDSLIFILNEKTGEKIEQFKLSHPIHASIKGCETILATGPDGILSTIFKDQSIHKILLTEKSSYHLYFIDIDSTVLVSSDNLGFEVEIKAQKILKTFNGHTDQVFCIMPSNSKTKVITASLDSTIMVFDRFSGSILFKSGKLDGQVYVASFDKSDSLIAASTSNGTIYFFDEELRQMRVIKNAFKNQVINNIHFSPKEKHLLAASEEGGAKIFSTITGELLYELKD